MDAIARKEKLEGRLPALLRGNPEIPRIYDLDRNGVVYIPDAMPLDIVSEAASELRFYKDAGLFKGGFDNATITINADIGPSSLYGSGVKNPGLPAIDALKHAYAIDVYNFIADIGGFPHIDSSVVTIFGVYYPPVSGSFYRHRDLSQNSNLVGIISLTGHAIARIGEVQSRFMPMDLEASYAVSPGGLMLMRAERECDIVDRNDLRPYHSIDSVDGERFSLVFRTLRDHLTDNSDFEDLRDRSFAARLAAQLRR